MDTVNIFQYLLLAKHCADSCAYDGEIKQQKSFTFFELIVSVCAIRKTYMLDAYQCFSDHLFM